MQIRKLVRLAGLLPLLLLAAPLAAQSGPTVGPASGPTFETATLGYQPDVATGSDMTWDNSSRSSRSSGRILAIVGGAAFIGGLLIEGDAGTAIAVGGLVVGLIGLYQWLK